MLLSYLVTIGLVAVLATSVSFAVGSPLKTRPGHHHARGALRVAAYSLWTSTEGQWQLTGKCGQQNCDCGPEPQRPGQYEGEVVRKECPAQGTPARRTAG